MPSKRFPMSKQQFRKYLVENRETVFCRRHPALCPLSMALGDGWIVGAFDADKRDGPALLSARLPPWAKSFVARVDEGGEGSITGAEALEILSAGDAR